MISIEIGGETLSDKDVSGGIFDEEMALPSLERRRVVGTPGV